MGVCRSAVEGIVKALLMLALILAGCASGAPRWYNYGDLYRYQHPGCCCDSRNSYNADSDYRRPKKPPFPPAAMRTLHAR